MQVMLGIDKTESLNTCDRMMRQVTFTAMKGNRRYDVSVCHVYGGDTSEYWSVRVLLPGGRTNKLGKTFYDRAQMLDHYRKSIGETLAELF